MEPDRYAQNHGIYITGLLCLVSSIGLFAFLLYLLPNFFLDWSYNVPGFITNIRAFLEDHYHVSMRGAASAISIVLFIVSVILFIVADMLSNRIDSKIYGISSPKLRANRSETASTAAPQSETKYLVVKIVLSIIIIFFVAQFFHWVISSR